MDETLRARLEEARVLLESGRSDLAALAVFRLAREMGVLAMRPRSLWEPVKVRCVLESLLATEDVAGDVAELGVYQGGGSFLIAETLERLQSQRTLYAVDSFQGLPEPVQEDYVPSKQAIHYVRGMFSDTTREWLDFVLEFFGLAHRVRTVAGFFEEALPRAFPQKDPFSMVIIDCDQYLGTKYCLEFFYDRIPPGGRILVDDFRGTFAAGVTAAVDEFLADKPEEMVQGGFTMWYCVKK